MKCTFKWDTRCLSVFVPVLVTTPSGIAAEAKKTQAELDKVLQDFIVLEPDVESARNGLWFTFKFWFDPDTFRFNPDTCQREFIVDPRKQLLEKRLLASGAKEAR